jgi:hypothetical protein
VERFRNSFVLVWFGAVAIGIPIFGHGFVWPSVFVAIAYCLIDALLGGAKNPPCGGAQNLDNITAHDEHENQVDARKKSTRCPPRC